MQSAIISGATGAIGTALINELISHNVKILVLCRKGSGRNGVIPDSPLIKRIYTDLSEFADIENVNGEKYDVFYHFAWSGTFGDTRNDMYLQNKNVRYALDAVGLAKRFGCKTFIGAGSQAEYGRVEGVLKPTTPAFPENGYGMAKLCAGQMTREYAHKRGLQHVWTRILSVYGPNDGAYTMVSSTVNKLKNGEAPQFTKAEQLWDYLYSKDAAKAFYLLGESGRDGKVYVLGSGQARPLKEYIFAIKNAVAPNGEIALGAIPYGDRQVMHLQADISELQNDTGWQPCYTFEQGLKDMLIVQNSGRTR